MRNAMFRNWLLTLAVAATAPWFTAVAHAQEYPAKPIRMIVPFPPGALTDALARLVADKLQGRWGQPFIVENRAGAGGNLGAEVVARADPDGYTLLFAPPGPLYLNKLLYAKLAYDPDQFAPISLLVTGPVVLAVATAVPAQNLQQLMGMPRPIRGSSITPRAAAAIPRISPRNCSIHSRACRPFMCPTRALRPPLRR